MLGNKKIIDDVMALKILHYMHETHTYKIL